MVNPAYFPVLLIQPWGIPVKEALIGCLLSARARDWAGGAGHTAIQAVIMKPSVLYQSVSTRCFVLMLMRLFISILSISTPTVFWQRSAEAWFTNKQWWIASKTNLTVSEERQWCQILLNCIHFHLPQKIITLLLFVLKTQTIHLFLPRCFYLIF